MTEPDSRDADVLALRRAGEAADSNACQEAVRRLLLRVPAPRALEVTRQVVAARLPGFERHQPGVTWPRELIDAVRRTGRWQGHTLPEADAFTGPGANNFIQAVESLWEARHLADDDEKRVTALVRAIANAIMAEKLEAWGSHHFEQWALWYRETMEGQRRVENQELQREMVLGPEGRRIGRRAWLEVAESLDKAISERHPLDG